MFGVGIHLRWVTMGRLFKLFSVLLLFQVSYLQKGNNNRLLWGFYVAYLAQFIKRLLCDRYLTNTG